MAGLLEALGTIGGGAIEGAGRGWLEGLKADAIRQRDENLLRLQEAYRQPAEKRAAEAHSLLMESGNLTLNKAKNEAKAQAEIAELAKAYEASKLTQPTTKTPILQDTPKDATPNAGTAPPNTQATVDQGILKQPNAVSGGEKDTSQTLKLKAKLDSEIINIYRKYGMMDKVLEAEKNVFNTMRDIGASIGPQAALTYAKNTQYADMFEGAKAKDEKEFAIVALRDGSAMRINKQTGEYSLIKSSENSITTKLEEIFNKSGQRQKVIMQTDEKGAAKVTPVGGPAAKDGGSLERGEGEAVKEILGSKYLNVVLNNQKVKEMFPDEIAKINHTNVMNFAEPNQREAYDWIRIKAEGYAKDGKKFTPASAVNQALKDYNAGAKAPAVKAGSTKAKFGHLWGQ